MEEKHSGFRDMDHLSIKDIFFKYIRFIPFIFLSVSLCLLGAFLYLRWTTPVYRVGGTITFKTEENPRGDKFDDIFLAKSVNDIQTEIEILKSRPLMERVVDSARLQTNYYSIGKIVKSHNIYKSCPFRFDILKIADSTRAYRIDLTFISENEFTINNDEKKYTIGQLVENSFGQFSITKINDGISGKEFYLEWNPTSYQAAIYAPMIRVSPKIVGSNIYKIEIDNTNSKLGADIINNVMQEYLRASIEDKNVTINQRLEYINQQLAKFARDVDSLEERLVRYKKDNNLTDEQEQAKNLFGIISESGNAVKNQQLQLKIAEILEDYLKDTVYKYERVPTTLSLEDGTLNGMVEAYNRLQLERKKLLDNRVPEKNIQVRQKNTEIENIRTNILETLASIRKSYEIIIDDFYKRESSAQGKVKMIPEISQKLMEIERERDGKLALYKFLLEQREETAMSQASTISNSKILEFAEPTSIPIKPNRKVIWMLALIIGIGLPVMFIFFIEIINDKVNTRSDIEKITTASIIGEVGHSFSGSSMIVSKTNRSMVSEQFRNIRSNLQYVLNKIERPVIMVTSSFSAEGKSFISTNLGAVMALTGKKTVIMEFDIRKPKLFSGLKLHSQKGITHFIVGKASLEELPVKVPGFDNLYAISCGPVPPNPSELLLDSRIDELFEWVRNNFDVVILDTAPVGMVSDAMTLAKFVDSTLYVVRQGHTYRKQVSLIDEFYKDNRLSRISIIINDVKIKPGYGYSGYGRYGYGYGHASGYYDSEDAVDAPKSVIMMNKFKRFFRRKKS
jgi:capsular exopolysaccharide synthesis family protein